MSRTEDLIEALCADGAPVAAHKDGHGWALLALVAVATLAIVPLGEPMRADILGLSDGAERALLIALLAICIKPVPS